MVLGLRSKTRKGTSVQVDYIVNVQKIRPWPPSQSLRSVRSVLLLWEAGDQNSGSISAVAGDSMIEFNEPFMLPLTLSREKRTHDNFQKNCLEFYLYESRKDRSAKGQLLGTAIINLADYGIIKDNIGISALVNCKKSSKSSALPVLYVNVQPFDKENSYQSPNDSLSKEASLDKEGELVKELVNVENDDESDISFLSEDDISSHSSHTVSTSAFVVDSSISQPKDVVNGKGKSPKNSQESAGDNAEDELVSEVQSAGEYVNSGEDYQRNANYHGPQVERQSESGNQVRNELPESGESKIMDRKGDILENQFGDKSSRDAVRKHAPLRSETLAPNRRAATNSKLKHMMSVQLPSDSDVLSGEIQDLAKARDINESSQAQLHARFSDTAKGSKPSSRSSVRKPNGGPSQEKPISGSPGSELSSVSSQQKQQSGSSEGNLEWNFRFEMLEEELKEAAILEAALYSVVAEHGSSTNKLHTPARRLSRFYLHATKATPFVKIASAARAAVSGLILVSKSSGNDVPRLTFWLSNSIVLRSIIHQAVQRTPLPQKSNVRTEDGGRPSQDKLSSNGRGKSNQIQPGDWENPQTLIIALEKVEAWIFYRIVESVWWQTLTPHMQSAAAKSNGKNSSSRRNKYVFGDQEQGNFSIELWKKAFKEACERLCPIRAGGHECGCLPGLPKLVMEQLVDRLDVAMFNAVLRESGDEMPTDPVSDPISDPKILPIPAGKFSFGGGAQLKNAIGNWSRWLSDLFGIEDNDTPEGENVDNDDDKSELDSGRSFKVFRLLNALSDLMMLPIEMLADSATRKEVFPIFGVEVIKRVLNNFIPDEFSPQPIPTDVIEALDTEDEDEDSGEMVTFPFTATPTVYSPPPAASLAGFIGEVGNQALQRCTSSVLRKSYTSDDELDELNSPITPIIIDKNHVSSSSSSTESAWLPKGGREVVRYQLLREVWRDG